MGNGVVHPPSCSKPSDLALPVVKEAEPDANSGESFLHHHGLSSARCRKTWKASSTHTRAFICRFCGGKACKHEDWTKQRTVPAIRGLNSSWITKDVLACQRPSSRLLRAFDVVGQFKRNRINAVFNLQVAGEHPLCGDGINAGGFSYNTEEFMEQGIFFYNFGWTDMDVPSLEHCLNLVKVISHAVVERGDKVAIHCHAGYGRTGLAIAAWLIYELGIDADKAVATIRARRPGSVQTLKQRAFLHRFSLFVAGLRRSFLLPPYLPETETTPQSDEEGGDGSDGDGAAEQKSETSAWPSEFGSYAGFCTLEEFLKKQSLFLRGTDRQTHLHVPKVVAVLCNLLRSRVDTNARDASLLLHAVPAELVASSFYDLCVDGRGWGGKEEGALQQLKRRLNQDDWYNLESIDHRFLSQLLLDWLDTLKSPLIPAAVTRFVLSSCAGRVSSNAYLSLHLLSLFNSSLSADSLSTLAHIVRMLRVLLNSHDKGLTGFERVGLATQELLCMRMFSQRRGGLAQPPSHSHLLFRTLRGALHGQRADKLVRPLVSLGSFSRRFSKKSVFLRQANQAHLDFVHSDFDKALVEAAPVPALDSVQFIQPPLDLQQDLSLGSHEAGPVAALVVLGRFVRQLVDHWDDLVGPTVRTLASQSVGVSHVTYNLLSRPHVKHALDGSSRSELEFQKADLRHIIACEQKLRLQRARGEEEEWANGADLAQATHSMQCTSLFSRLNVRSQAALLDRLLSIYAGTRSQADNPHQLRSFAHERVRLQLRPQRHSPVTAGVGRHIAREQNGLDSFRQSEENERKTGSKFTARSSGSLLRMQANEGSKLASLLTEKTPDYLSQPQALSSSEQALALSRGEFPTPKASSSWLPVLEMPLSPRQRRLQSHSKGKMD